MDIWTVANDSDDHLMLCLVRTSVGVASYACDSDNGAA